MDKQCPVLEQEPGYHRGRIILNADLAINIYIYGVVLCNIKGQSVHVGNKFGVSPKTVRDIWNHRTWIHCTRHLWSLNAGRQKLSKVANFTAVFSHGNLFEIFTVSFHRFLNAWLLWNPLGPAVWLQWNPLGAVVCLHGTFIGLAVRLHWNPLGAVVFLQ